MASNLGGAAWMTLSLYSVMLVPDNQRRSKIAAVVLPMFSSVGPRESAAGQASFRQFQAAVQAICVDDMEETLFYAPKHWHDSARASGIVNLRHLRAVVARQKRTPPGHRSAGICTGKTPGTLLPALYSRCDHPAQLAIKARTL